MHEDQEVEKETFQYLEQGSYSWNRRQKSRGRDGWEQKSRGVGDMRRGGIVKITVGGKRVAMSNRSKGRRKVQG